MPAAKPTPVPLSSPLAYSYIRFSSRAQEEGDSFRRQTEAAETWCRENKVALDTSLRFEDRGRSAYRKHHTDRAALSEFRRLVAEGRIRPGSFLIVEALDRLSREEVRIGVELLLSIVNSGINIVQLMPEEKVFGPNNLDMVGLMLAVIHLAQSHEESAKKAERLGKAWAQKRKEAIEGTGTLTSRVPGWIDLVDGKMKLNTTRATVVRRIFKMCIAGYGGQATARELNKEAVPTMTGRGKWRQSAVTYILRTRSVVGEHQPHSQHGAEKRQPIGEPIKDYYPAVVDEDTWNAAQAALAVRVSPGRPPRTRSNIFRGLLRDARNGGTIGIMTQSWESGKKKVIVYNNNDRGAGERQYSFPAETFDAAVLSKLKEIDSREVVGESPTAERVLALTGERAELVAKIERTAEALGGQDSPTITAKITKWEEELRKLDDRLAEAQQEAANPLANAWGDLPGLVEIAATPEGRVRLAAVLRRVVENVYCLFARNGDYRLAAVQIRFTGGVHRDYLIMHQPTKPLGHGTKTSGPKLRPAQWWVRSFAEFDAPADIDLRKPDHAAIMEKLLGENEFVESLFASDIAKAKRLRRRDRG
jgi:DNA invertase Pin-like site-specific DNA recombinase